jgi:hypothetical protein
MIGFIIGLFVGAAIGIFGIALVSANRGDKNERKD